MLFYVEYIRMWRLSMIRKIIHLVSGKILEIFKLIYEKMKSGKLRCMHEA